MSRFFRSCCFWKVSAPTLGHYSRNLAFAEPELKPGSLGGAKQGVTGSSFLQRIFHRPSKEEEILLLERRYLKRYLRHYKLYLDHMTLPEMRLAKRCVEESTSSESSTSPTSRASPKAQPGKHVPLHRTAGYVPVPLLSESSNDSAEDEVFEFGPFLLGGDNGPTYVAFEQPEP
ncbi:uncharacterized protein LOC119767804 isoform X2 [Culex quinquefasciatus]|uniref:uncharacterized protein LOC119767804 isoform X2 n=1 Tax=Culex quinquefasciatus TaxID=7176 RepID=UPI0018E2FBDF|nr:uncharacterized protein LOC119767804 isoform X2 [Culex quinquefasciatus]